VEHVTVGILRKLTDKPWLVTDTERKPVVETELHSAAPTALRVYFAVASVMFALVIAVYLMRMGIGHTMGFQDWSPTPEPVLLWINTLLLFVNSLAFQHTYNVARRGQMDRVEVGLLASGFLSFLFLAGQLIVWRQLTTRGFYLTSNPANSFFYLITTLHGLHMLGGLIAWTRTVLKFRAAVPAAKLTLSIRLCAMYWHFLLIVWLAFFYLMLVT
jgi:cytochrome c oxidase subunit 3